MAGCRGGHGHWRRRAGGGGAVGARGARPWAGGGALVHGGHQIGAFEPQHQEEPHELKSRGAGAGGTHGREWAKPLSLSGANGFDAVEVKITLCPRGYHVPPETLTRNNGRFSIVLESGPCMHFIEPIFRTQYCADTPYD